MDSILGKLVDANEFLKAAMESLDSAMIRIVAEGNQATPFGLLIEDQIRESQHDISDALGRINRLKKAIGGQ